MTSGHVNFTVRRRDHIPSFDAFPNWSFTDYNALDDSGSYWARWGERSYSFEVTSEEAELDNHGRAFLRFSTKDKEEQLKTAQDYLIEAEVSDASQASMTRSLALVAHRGPLYLGIHPREIIPTAGKPTIIDAVAVDDEGKPRATEAELVVSLRSWKCDWQTSPGSVFGSYQCKDTSRELERRKVTLGAAPVALEVTPAQPGTLRVSLRAPDGRGHEVVASDEIWAVGSGDVSWRLDTDARVPLIAGKPQYKPGETARLVAQAPLAHTTALITVERDGVIAHEVKKFESSGQPVDVPINAAYAPNVYASVVLVRGRSGDGDRGKPVFRMGVVNLEVDSAQKKLAVTVVTDKPSYRPGDPVKAKVTVKDASGAPVNAEVALAAADEGVLQLIGFQTPDPRAAFYAPFGLGVESATNWNRLAKQWDPNENDGEGGDGGETSGHVRSKFVSTAFWAPQLVTGPDGTVEASFTAPDNLTAFRLMAVVADAGDRFGSGEVRMTVAKPLSALPALPRFFTVGDHGQAGVVVHNDTGQSGSVTVSAEADGLVLGEKKKTVSVATGAAKPVLFDVSAKKTGTAKIIFHAQLGDEKDIVQLSIPVERPVENETQLVGEGEANNTAATLALALPDKALDESGGLEVTLDGSGLSGVDEGLRYLIEYPYGCLEQTTSRVVPMAKVEDLARSLDLPGLRGPELKKFVEAGIAKIIRHQHEDGAFSLWPGSHTEPFLTAFALYGLTQARHAGYHVEGKVIDRGVEALRRDLGERKSMGEWDNILGENGSRAFAMWILAELGKPDAGGMAKLFDERNTLPVFGEAFLAAAMKKGGGAAASIDALVADVTSHAQPLLDGKPGKRIVDPGQEHLWWYYSDDARTTAIALSSLLVAAPEHPLIPELARGLLSMRQGGRWDNTQDNLFSLVALADYARLKAPADRAQSVAVALDGKSLFDGKLGKGVRRVRVPLKDLKAGKLTITPAGGRVTYAARIRFARSLEHAEPESSGLTIARTLKDETSAHEITELKAGDIVSVVLRVHTSEERAHIAVVDRLPAGLEPINPRFANNGAGTNSDDEEGRYWDGEPRWVAMELHDDRVALFADRLVNELEFSYLARATTSGTFLLPPATVEEMYRPEHRARTAAGTLEVKAK